MDRASHRPRIPLYLLLLLAKNSWSCVTLTDIVAADPDVMIVVAAAFDTSMEKIDFMHNHSLFCSAAGSNFPPWQRLSSAPASSSSAALALRPGAQESL